jgi:AraC-like DNA-binding protein
MAEQARVPRRGFTDHDPGIRILTCACFRLSQWSIRDGSAPHWRLYWNDRPGASAVWTGSPTALRPDRLLLIPPETSFAGRLRRPVRHFFVHFLADPPYDRAEPGVYAFTAGREAVRTVGETAAELGRESGPGPRAGLLCRALVAQALSRFPQRRLHTAPVDERILAAVRAVERSRSRPLSNAEMAAIAGMSTSAFARVFASSMGRTPQAWQTARRIAASCILLAGSTRSIEEIAAEAGFCDRYHFSRVFKRLRGTGPAEYRRRSQLERGGN